jgi:rhamnose transport system ATP-binding protein
MNSDPHIERSNLGTPLLRLAGVTKSFGAVRALKGVSFDLRAGEVHALLGENGAGKSTLIKVIAGAHGPDGGELEVFGSRLDRLDPGTAHRLGIACIYQQPALFPDLTVAENLGIRLEPSTPWRRIDPAARRSRAEALLQRVGARISPEAEVRSLSMPEQQLVEIACALGAGARVLIMDEPTASLTRREVERLFELVRDLRSQGVGIIYISHRLEEIFALADRVTVLRDGESIDTRPVRDSEGRLQLTESELIQCMVGREIAQLYPAPLRPPGAVAVKLNQVGCAESGVRNVSLEIREGEILGMSGLVGAGRTELARVLFGLTPADSGGIQIGGTTVTIRSPRDAMRHGIAYVPEDRRRHGVILEMPVADNLSLAVLRRLFTGGWLLASTERRMATDLIQRLGVKCAGPQALAGSLSGGNQQKVALGRWLATQPKWLILDEPTQGVDVGAKGEIHKLIRELAGSGLAVLLISSDLPEVIGMSDRIAVMRGGTVISTLPGGSTAAQVMAAALGQSEEAQ